MIIYVHDSSDTNSFSYISNLRVGRVCAKSRVRCLTAATILARPYSHDIRRDKIGPGPGAAGELSTLEAADIADGSDTKSSRTCTAAD